MVMEKRQHFDLNVPLSSSSTSRRKRQEAQVHRARLRHLGYRGVAFCHAAHGRLSADRDDADAALPWADIAPPGPPSEGEDVGSLELLSGGRSDPAGTRVYRRLNILIEDAGDASRLLLSGSGDAASVGVSSIVAKYDVVSLQPMSEPALRSVCELLTPSSVDPGGAALFSSAGFVDIIVLEYATGSRGGLGLPYRLRKEYVEKALRAGVMLELCYSAAVVDPKRRQGFLHALTDFKSAFDGIQKKHVLLNKCSGGGQRENFPLLLSSGPRNDYTQGTGDEGALAFRSPDDVKFMVRHFAGLKNVGADGTHLDDEDEDTARNPKHKKLTRQNLTPEVSVAEMVLARVCDRASGMICPSPPIRGKKRKRGGGRCVRVVGGDTTGDPPAKMENDEGKGEGDGQSHAKGIPGLFNWLAEPMLGKGVERKKSLKKREIAKTCDVEMRLGSGCKDAVVCEARSAREEREKQNESATDDKGDLEDGFIAL